MAQAIRDWAHMPSFSTHESAGKAGGASHPIPSYAELITMFRESPSQQSAYHAIIQGLGLDTCIVAGHVIERDPLNVRSIISHIVENILIFGWVAYKINPKTTLPEIALPGSILIGFDHSKSEWVPVASKRFSAMLEGTDGWQLVIFDEPFKPVETTAMAATSKVHTVKPVDLRSACSRSFTAAARQQLIESQWLARDRFNSAPSAFTTISKDLGNTDGKLNTWFRNLHANNATSLHHSSSNVDNPNDFASLIQNRADTIRRLSENTYAEKDRVARDQAVRAATTVAGRAEAAYGNVNHDHIEYALTDGKTMVDSKTLMSTNDGHIHHMRTRQTVLQLMGCPPQAIGESVNSERNASNHRQYEVAMALWHTTMRRFRDVVAVVFETMELELEPPVPVHALDIVAPVLKTKSLKRRFAEAYNISQSDIDETRLAAWQDALMGNGNGEGAAAPETADGPGESKERHGDKERANAKRNKTEPPP